MATETMMIRTMAGTPDTTGTHREKNPPDFYPVAIQLVTTNFVSLDLVPHQSTLPMDIAALAAADLEEAEMDPSVAFAWVGGCRDGDRASPLLPPGRISRPIIITTHHRRPTTATQSFLVNHDRPVRCPR